MIFSELEVLIESILLNLAKVVLANGPHNERKIFFPMNFIMKTATRQHILKDLIAF